MIELKNLTKKFDDFTAVDRLSLRIETGEFFGLLGPNGAGKTTTISMMSTVLLPTEGEILIDGQRLDRKASAQKRKLSVITQEYSMRQDMNMDEVMEYQGRLYYLPRKVIKQKTDELLEFAGLIEYRHRTVRHLSGGMKRKLMICRALMIEPEILLLDEPTAGMDALSRRQMWNLLRRVNGDKIDHRADHPLHRGGPGAVQSRGAHQPGAASKAGHSGQPDPSAGRVRRGRDRPGQPGQPVLSQPGRGDRLPFKGGQGCVAAGHDAGGRVRGCGGEEAVDGHHHCTLGKVGGV